MKLLLLIVFFVPIFACSQNKGIQFETGIGWQQIIAKAKKENKYIFIDCFASWCAPCRAMDSLVYSIDAIGNYVNPRFVSIKVQMDTTKKDNEKIKEWYSVAHDLQIRYNINAFPTYLFFSPEGKVAHKDIGFKKAEDFIEVFMEATDTNKQYYTLLQSYLAGNLDTIYMKALARTVKLLDNENLAENIANDYINSLSEEDMYKKENIRFIADFTKSSKERGFAFFKDKADKIKAIDSSMIEPIGYAKWIIYNEELAPYIKSKRGKADWERMVQNAKRYGKLGTITFNDFRPGIIFTTEIEPQLKKQLPWNTIIKLIRQQHAGKGQEFLVGSSIVYYLNAIVINKTEKTCKNLVNAATLYVKMYPSFWKAANRNPLNTWAWVVFENSNNKIELQKALSWSSLCIENNPAEPAYYDTYANLLYKLGRVRDAIKTEEKAMSLENDKAIKENRSADNIYKTTLQKMNEGTVTWPNKLSD